MTATTKGVGRAATGLALLAMVGPAGAEQGGGSGRDVVLRDVPVREAETHAGRIRYRAVGQGPAIVFIHGLIVDGMLWRKVVPELARDFTCIVPDLPLGSHALPMRADADLTPPGLARIITDFLAALDLQEVTLVANDTGGALTQLALVHDASRVARVVFTPSDAFDNFLPLAFRPFQWGAHVPGFVYLATQALGVTALHMTPVAYGGLTKHGIESDVTNGWTTPARENPDIRHDLGKILRGISSSYTLEAAEKLDAFRGPVLLAWAADDQFFPLDHAHRLARIFPDARVEEVADSRTFVPEDQPEKLTAMIRRFVGSNARTAEATAG